MAALGASLSAQLATFIVDGGVVVVLEGAGGTSHHFATAAGLATITGITAAEGATVSIGVPTDGVATGVPAPYYGASSTVTFQTASPGVLVDEGGYPIVVHATP